jgi:NADPH2:quinone reductase
MSIPETYKALISDGSGEPILKEFPVPKPSTSQVLIKVEFSPINPTDLLRFKGFYGKPTDHASSLIGTEGSGTVIAVGNDLKVPHKVGDRVHIRYGSWGQYLLASSEEVSSILQSDLSFEDAASHWVNPATVYYMGVVAERGGHKAAIHTAASSALGKMLIRYFKHKGIKLINVVRKDEYVEELKAEGADYVLNSQAPDFESQLKELAHKENATLSFDAISGDFPSLLLRCQPAESYCYVYGGLSGTGVNKLNRLDLMREKVLTALSIPHYIEELKERNELGKFLDEVHKFLPTFFRTNVHKIYLLEDIKEAIAYYEKNSSKGKILLKLH